MDQDFAVEYDGEIFLEMPDGDDPKRRWAVVNLFPHQPESQEGRQWAVVSYDVWEMDGHLVINGPLKQFVDDDAQSMFSLFDAVYICSVNAWMDCKGRNHSQAFGGEQINVHLKTE
jgi:hypothetical protein